MLISSDCALGRVALRPPGSLVLIGGTSGRRASAGPLICAVTAAMPTLARSLAFELAPVRVNLVAPGFVDTPLSASILGKGLETAQHEQLRATLPNSARRGGRGRGCARSRPNGQHRSDGCDLRHRRRPTAGRSLSSSGESAVTPRHTPTPPM